MSAKIFRFLSGICRVIGRHVPHRKENLTVCVYKLRGKDYGYQRMGIQQGVCRD